MLSVLNVCNCGEATHRFMGQGLLTIPDYDTWKPRRKLYDPLFKRRYLGHIGWYGVDIFHCSSLKDLLPVFNECVDAFLEGLRPLADGKTEVPMKEAFHEAALDVISKVQLCLKLCNYHNKSDNKNFSLKDFCCADLAYEIILKKEFLSTCIHIV